MLFNIRIKKMFKCISIFFMGGDGLKVNRLFVYLFYLSAPIDH